MRRRWLLAAATPLLAAALAGCDEGASSTPAAPPAPAPTSAPATPTPTPAPEPPPAPTGLHVADATPDSITWRWNPVEGATGYDVQISLDEMFTAEDRIVARDVTSFTLPGLEPDTPAYLRVAAVAGSATAPLRSAWTTHVTGRTSLPPIPVPTGLRVSATTPDSITWRWNPVEGAAGYAVQVSLDEMFKAEDAIVAREGTSFTLLRLAPDTPAYLRVAAVAGSAAAPVRGAWTTHVSGRTSPPPAPEPPPAPTGLHVADATPDSITWRWNPVEGVVGYAVQISLDETFDEEDRFVFTIDTVFRLDGLEPDTPAYLRVAATADSQEAPLQSAWTTHVTGRTSSRPGPTPPPPSPNARTVIGFAAPARAFAFEGGRVRAPVAVSRRLLRSPLRLSVESSAPSAQLQAPEEIEIARFEHGFVELVIPADQRSEATASYQVTLREPPAGLPDGVELDAAATTFRVTVQDGERTPGCGRLSLVAAGEDYDSTGEFSTARLTLEGPQRAGLRLLKPYWNDFFEQQDPPPELPIDLSRVPRVTLAIPNALPYQGLSDRGHRQQITLSWFNDLDLAAVAPQCEPVPLRCSDETILQQGCTR